LTQAPINNPHDRYARQLLTHPERAKDFLNNFLPEVVKAQLDFSTLEIDPTEYVDSTLEEHRTDVLFALRYCNNDPLFVYVLVEHKSYIEARVAFQLLRYMVRIWEKCDKNAPLPMVLPLVLYHGERSWEVSKQFKDLFQVLLGTEPYLVDFSYQLLNLKEIADEKI
jgi:predicted transposase/invertase (TIGR01784 family)